MHTFNDGPTTLFTCVTSRWISAAARHRSTAWAWRHCRRSRCSGLQGRRRRRFWGRSGRRCGRWRRGNCGRRCCRRWGRAMRFRRRILEKRGKGVNNSNRFCVQCRLHFFGKTCPNAACLLETQSGRKRTKTTHTSVPSETRPRCLQRQNMFYVSNKNVGSSTVAKQYEVTWRIESSWALRASCFPNAAGDVSYITTHWWFLISPSAGCILSTTVSCCWLLLPCFFQLYCISTFICIALASYSIQLTSETQTKNRIFRFREERSNKKEFRLFFCIPSCFVRSFPSVVDVYHVWGFSAGGTSERKICWLTPRHRPHVWHNAKNPNSFSEFLLYSEASFKYKF